VKRTILVLLLACPAAVHAIEPYQAQQIEVYRGSSIEPNKGQAVKPYKADTVRPYQSGTVKPYQAETVKPYQAQTVKPYQAETVRPYQADSIEQNRGDAIEPQKPAPTVQPAPSRQIQQSNGGRIVPVPAVPAPSPEKQKSAGDGSQTAKSVIGVWQTNVPGAVYTTPSGVSGYDLLHVSTGAVAGLLRINANGTYSWNSYGGKKGKWVATSDPDYPVEIIDTVENRRWRVGYSASKRTLLVWDGSIWYEGRKAAVKKK